MARSLRNMAPGPNLLAPVQFEKTALPKFPKAGPLRPQAGTSLIPTMKPPMPKIGPRPSPVTSEMDDLVQAINGAKPKVPAPLPPPPPPPRSTAAVRVEPMPPRAPLPPEPFKMTGAEKALLGGGLAGGAGIGGALMMSGGKEGPPTASAAPAAPAPAGPGLVERATEALPESVRPAASAVGNHLQQYWPGYAIGGLGALALLNATRRKKRTADMYKYSQDFAQRHPLVAEFLVKCAHLKLSDVQIQARIHTMALIDDDIRERFSSAFQDDYFKQAGLLSNMGNNASRFSNGLWGSLGGGLGTLASGATWLGAQGANRVADAGDMLMGKDTMPRVSQQNMAGIEQAFDDSGRLARAGVSDMGRSLGGEANDYTTSDVNNLFHEVRNREGVTPGVRTTSHVAGGLSSTAAAGAEILGGPGALANTVGKIPGVSTATTAAMSKMPYGQQTMQGAQSLRTLGQANLGTAQGLGQVGSAALPTAQAVAGEIAGRDALFGGINAYNDRPVLEGSQTRAIAEMLGQKPQPGQQSAMAEQQINAPVPDNQPPPNEGDMGGANPLPGDALPGSEVATQNPAMAAAPQQASPGANASAAGGQPGSPGQPGAAGQPPAGVDDNQLKTVAADPAVPVEAKQQMATSAAEDALGRLAKDSGMNPDQAKQYVGRMVQEGLTPEEHQVGMERFGKAMMESDPQAAQQPGFMDQVSQGWNNMDSGSKALMFIGGGLGLLGLVNAIGGEGGVGNWLLAALGLGAAATVAGGAGMFGQGAQNAIGGVGQQIMGMLPGGTPAASQPPAAGQNPNIPKPGGAPAATPPAGGGGPMDFNAFARKQLDDQVVAEGRKQMAASGMGGLANAGRYIGLGDWIDPQITGKIDEVLRSKGIKPESFTPEDKKRWVEKILASN